MSSEDLLAAHPCTETADRRREAMRAIREAVRKANPTDRDLVEELIQERRLEAEHYSVGYAVESDVTAEEFHQLLLASTLAERRPADLARLDRMLRGANLTVTARIGGKLAGIARSVTDWAFCCYLSDLAVSKDVQGREIGRGLIEHTRQVCGPEVSVILSAAPGAVTFYESIGMPRLPDAFCYRRME